MSVTTQNFQMLVHCPTTGERVLGEYVTHFVIQGRKGVWWRCPACEGWHVELYEVEKEMSEEYRPRLNQLGLNVV